jgi:hypothetical protein
MTRRLFFCLLLLLPALLAAQPQFAFEGEILNFSLDHHSAQSDTLLWSVSGVYYMSNLHNEPLSRMVWFPVPSSDSIGVAENVEVTFSEYADSMAVELVRQTPQGFGFLLDLPARSFAGIQISYTQKVWGSEARYVLLTTNSWGRRYPPRKSTCICPRTLPSGNTPIPIPRWFLRGKTLPSIGNGWTSCRTRTSS